MPRDPRVSVIMASFNHAGFVGQAVDSVLSQSFTDFEFVITDDGSSDATVDVIRGYADPRVQLEVFPQNRGACHAMNRCIERSKGEYISVINSDDWFLPGKLEAQVEFLDRHRDIAAVFAKPIMVDEAGALLDKENNPFGDIFIDDLPDRFAWLRFFFYHHNALCHPTVMIRRSVYDVVGLYSPSLRQLPDFDMWVRICARYEIRVMPKQLIAFRVLSGQRNTSAGTPEALLRSLWEQTRVQHRFLNLDTRTFNLTFPEELACEAGWLDLPIAVRLARTAGARSDARLELFALEMMEKAVADGLAGASLDELHAMTGRLDPFRSKALAASEAAFAVAQATSIAAGQARQEAVRRSELAEATLIAVEQSRQEAVRRSELAEATLIAVEQARQEAVEQSELAEATLIAVEQSRQEAVRRSELADAGLSAVHSSTSWRITIPCRAISRLLRR